MEQNELFKKRHSLSHLLAMAVLEYDPEAKLAIGPVIDNGFYYDFEFSSGKTPSGESLKSFEEEMRGLVSKNLDFILRDLDEKEAREIFKDQPYKLELIDELVKKGEKLTAYKTAGFIDLCRGPHIANTKEIDPEAFSITHIAGAYWRGSEKNKMLTRIYGLAFDTKAELDAYVENQKEAEKRDHRKLGKELKIFAFDDDVGPGLPLWLPNGAIIIEELEKLAKETEFHEGYKRVRSPHLAKESMYVKSGHLPYYEESMYPPMEYEGGKYYLKAMNCPHHHKIYSALHPSYKDLPLRLAEYGTCYRHEKSGELFGLMRVRMLEMNDAHIYCTKEQFADEFRAVNDIYLKYFELFGIERYQMRFSTHDPKKLGEKFVDDPKLWRETEDMVRDVLKSSKIPFVEVPNEAAFYGPKIDVQVWSAIGREFTLATNQVDFAVPKRFDLTYTNSAGKEETPLCIHRAPLGTHERFIGFLIEHFAGSFPLWLSPLQVKVVPISDAHNEYAKEICKKLESANIRVELDDTKENLGKKIRSAKIEKVPYIVIIGDKEIEANKATLESRDKGNLGQKSIGELVEKLTEEIEHRNL